ncbi:MAG: hypothetical protein DSZ28_08920 [Thiothrix sp.]|nr:MAG: hypothetical protein DSZ28_08920 [Thiothrix sp.]
MHSLRGFFLSKGSALQYQTLQKKWPVYHDFYLRILPLDSCVQTDLKGEIRRQEGGSDYGKLRIAMFLVQSAILKRLKLIRKALLSRY